MTRAEELELFNSKESVDDYLARGGKIQKVHIMESAFNRKAGVWTENGVKRRYKRSNWTFSKNAPFENR